MKANYSRRTINEESDAFRIVSEWIDKQAAANSISTLIKLADSLTIASPVELKFSLNGFSCWSSRQDRSIF